MSSSSSITRAKSDHPRSAAQAPKKPSRAVKIITWGLIAIWLVLISFAAVSLWNPPWLQAIARAGKVVESRDYADYGDLSMKRGDVTSAIAQYQRALQIKPDFVTAQVNLAVAYSKTGRFAQAESLLRHALTLPSKQKGVIYFNLGDLCEKQNRPGEAVEPYQHALEYEFQPDVVYRRLGGIHFKAEDFGEACQEFEAALACQSDITSSYRDMLRLSLATYEHDSVNLPIIESLMARPSLDAEMAVYDTTLLRWMQEKDPEVSRTHNDLGISYAKLGDLERATQHIRRALQIWPDNASARDNLALINRLSNGAQSKSSAP